MSFNNVTTDKPTAEAKSKKMLKDFLRSFLVPTLIGKSFVLYFGLKYSEAPSGEDQFYAWGLGVSLAFTFFSLVFFAWKYKDIEDI